MGKSIVIVEQPHNGMHNSPREICSAGDEKGRGRWYYIIEKKNDLKGEDKKNLQAPLCSISKLVGGEPLCLGGD